MAVEGRNFCIHITIFVKLLNATYFTVISEARLNTRYGTECVVKTAVRNAAYSLAKPASNLP